MLYDIASRPTGNIAIVLCKVWVTATADQISSWHRYALATFMLGYTPGHAYFSFKSDHNLMDLNSMTSTDIGTPQAPYFANSSAFQRLFTGGTVVVNPTSAGVKVNLGGRYLSSAGKVITSISISAHGEAILKKA